MELHTLNDPASVLEKVALLLIEGNTEEASAILRARYPFVPWERPERTKRLEKGTVSVQKPSMYLNLGNILKRNH